MPKILIIIISTFTTTNNNSGIYALLESDYVIIEWSDMRTYNHNDENDFQVILLPENYTFGSPDELYGIDDLDIPMVITTKQSNGLFNNESINS